VAAADGPAEGGSRKREWVQAKGGKNELVCRKRHAAGQVSAQHAAARGAIAAAAMASLASRWPAIRDAQTRATDSLGHPIYYTRRVDPGLD
jgi:hypothetical protein